MCPPSGHAYHDAVRSWLPLAVLFTATLAAACEDQVDPPLERDAGADAGITSRPDAGAADAAAEPDAAASDAAAPDATEDDAGHADGGVNPDAEVPDTGPVVIAVTVTPTSAALVSIDGAPASQQFSVSATWSDGNQLTVTPAWTVDPVVLGTVDAASGVFTANGRFGGDGRVIATYRGVSGEASLRVRLEQTIIVAGTPTTAPSLFNTPPITDPARAAQILYPLDGAVMPQNVPPAEIQWDRSAPGDVFRIRLTKPNVSAIIFESTAVPNYRDSWVVDLDGWRRIAQSEPEEWASITVDRWEAATQQVIAGVPVQVRFPRAALLGSIYYWDIVRGRIVRINDGTATRDEFMPSPPLGCVGCHSVSTSGRYMAGRFGGGENVGGVLDLTQNLTTNPPPLQFPVTSTTVRWWFSAWSPDDSRMVVSVQEQGGARGLQLMDPFRGQFIQPLTGPLPQGAVTHPAWAPDDSAIAYVGAANSWGGANTTGNIYVLPKTGADAFGAPRLVASGTTALGLPAGNASSYPSWSPDSEWIAFAHGNSSRSESGRSALYMVRRDGTGLVRLDDASGGVSGDVSFQPRFSPFHQDGYFWLTFLSRRDYGNARAGTRNTGRQQIWVAAIKANPLPGEDPSEVPFWLSGQNTQSLNISAYWAPRACRMEAESCAVDAECCSGECDADPSGTLICQPPPAMCRELGQSCTDSDQCCDAVLCVDDTCGNL